jgi:hypothetical protein
MQDDVVALFAYDHSANTKVLDVCRNESASTSFYGLAT